MKRLTRIEGTLDRPDSILVWPGILLDEIDGPGRVNAWLIRPDGIRRQVRMDLYTEFVSYAPGAKDTRRRWATCLLDVSPDDAPAGSEIWIADDAQVIPHDQLPTRTAPPPPHESPACEVCGQRIPQFPDLPRSREARIRQLMTERDTVTAMRELVDATGCPLSWANLWVAHKGRAQTRPPGTTCSHCGGRLRTPQAKQCLECGMDWHDPHNVHRRGT